MKVGVCIGGTSPVTGGVHTFIIEILSALDRLRPQCNHELILCYDQSGEEIARKFPSFPGLNLDAARAQLLSRREKYVERLPNLAQRFYRFVHAGAVALSWQDRIYLREGIHFLVQLNPSDLSSTNV